MPVSGGLYYYDYQPTTPRPLPPVVLLHGAGGSHLSWPPELRRLGSHRVLAPDLPGHGKSRGHSEQRIHSFTQVLHGWLAAIQVHRIVLVGHSMGGAIALDFALTYPQMVAGLGLVSTGGRLPVNQTLIDNSAHDSTLPSVIAAIMEWSFSPHADPRTLELVAARFAEVRSSILHNDLLACQNFDCLEQLGRLQVPTTVICGDQDKMTPLRFSQLLSTKIAGATLQIIPDAGHMVMLEQPRQVCEALSEFLKTL